MSASDTARLIVLRHAESAWPQDADDHERPLGPRGLRDAPAVGRWLRDNGCVPDLVVCSTARRARDTWALMAPELGGAVPEVVQERGVYRATAADLLALVRRTPEERRTVLLIGHKAGVQDLVLSLAGDAGEPGMPGEPGRPGGGAAGAGGAEGARGGEDSGGGGTLVWARSMFPTCALAVLAVPGHWADLGPDGAALTVFAVPRGRRES